MGVGMAYKIIGEGDDAYTVLAIVPRSAGYEKEWAGNFTVGKEGLHQGFTTGRDIILDYAKTYVEEHVEDFVGKVKIWTVGYSRGAGVTNLLAAHLDDNSEALGIKVEKESIFAYGFGTPSTVQYANEEEKAALESRYLNIHNRYSEYDIVTYAPFKNWNFTYYGTTRLFDVHNAEKKAEMLTFLEKTNKTIYDLYTAENSTADPDNFLPVMMQLSIRDGVEFVPANPEYGIPTNQKDFLDSRIRFLVENLVPDRETYVDGGYEYALQRITSLYFGLKGDQLTALMEGMSHDPTTLLIAYYCYFLTDFYLDTEENVALAADTVALLASTLPVLEQYIGEMATNPAFNTQEWYQYIVTLMHDTEYEQFKAGLETIADDPTLLAEQASAIREAVKTFAVDVTACVLGSGVMALTMDEEEQEELFLTMTSPEVAEPLTEFLVYLLLGSDDGSVLTAFDPSNKNIALATTFVANAGRYMRVHNNEIILSWLRTEDSYYADKDWHIHVFDVYFDAEGHWEECECGHKEDVHAHALSEWAVLPLTEGEDEMAIRRCPCGYEEIARAVDVHPAADTHLTMLVVCAVVVVILAAGATVAVALVKKNKKTAVRK